MAPRGYIKPLATSPNRLGGNVMDNHYKEMIRFKLMEEISNINAQVDKLGKPRITAERSLIARYGKLLFVSQQLLDLLTELQIGEATKQAHKVPMAGRSDLLAARGAATLSRRPDAV